MKQSISWGVLFFLSCFFQFIIIQKHYSKLYFPPIYIPARNHGKGIRNRGERRKWQEEGATTCLKGKLRASRCFCRRWGSHPFGRTLAKTGLFRPQHHFNNTWAKGSSSPFSRIWFWCGVLKFSVVKGEFWELSKRPICAGRQCLVSPKSSLCLSKAPTKGTTWLPETARPGHLERGDNQKPPEIGCGQTSEIPAPPIPCFYLTGRYLIE